MIAGSSKAERPTYVVDAWPVLEWFRPRQPAAKLFQEFLLNAKISNSALLMSRMNYGEIRYRALDFFPADYVTQLLVKLSTYVDLISVDDALVDEAAALKFRFKVSYANDFAAALAVRSSAVVVTGDPDFLKLQTAGLLRVHWLGA